MMRWTTVAALAALLLAVGCTEDTGGDDNDNGDGFAEPDGFANPDPNPDGNPDGDPDPQPGPEPDAGPEPDPQPDPQPSGCDAIPEFDRSPAEWTIPRFTRIDRLAETGAFSWSTLDIDGDGRLDIVLTRSDSNAEVGGSFWFVFKGVDGGFSRSPIEWTIPRFTRIDRLAETGAFSWSTLDIDADGKLDIVLTRSDSNAEVGGSFWFVFKGVDGGFSRSPVEWTIPRFTRIDRLAETGAFSWSTIDIDADGKLDIVLTRSDSNAEVGGSFWFVFKGVDGGFSRSPVEWTIPRFTRIDRLAETGAFSWSTLDIDADGALDIVLTRSDTNAEVGGSFWFVFKGVDGGFSRSPVEWTIPRFTRIDRLAETGAFSWSTLDIDGSGSLDIVLTRSDSNAEVGGSFWFVFKGVDGGFSRSPVEWTIPRFTRIDRLAETGAFSWSTLDIDADGALDIVLTRSDTNTEVGGSFWFVFEGTCQ